jgi:ABC-type transport system involved in cytochrome c biogenesis permease subunit
MSQAVKSLDAMIGERDPSARSVLMGYLPALLPIVGTILMIAARLSGGQSKLFDDGGLIVLALLCYIFAAAFHLTDLYAPIKGLQKAGLWMMSLGFFFNLSSWMMRWITAGQQEGWKRMTDMDGVTHSWWFFSYIPFANLYDLSVAFAFGAVFATLLLEHRHSSRFVGAISLTLVTLVLLLAVFIGNEINSLQPILDSYWRPIHVGVASLSYGVALVSFAISVMFLLKDGVKPEAMGIFVALFILAGFVAFSNSYNFLALSYSVNPAIAGPEGTMFVKTARVALPGAGYLLTFALLSLAVTAFCFIQYHYNNNQQMRRLGHLALRVSLVAQAAGLFWVFYQIKTLKGVGSMIGQDQYRALGTWLAGSEAASMPVNQLVQGASNFLAQNGANLSLSVKANPVELAALVSAFVLTLFIVLFSFRTETLRESLPSLEKLDSLIYRTVGVAFAGLAILLVTGAIWANESWGRYWAWDPKETGAFVAWLAYGCYLHTRITHGWSGRRSAYFALVGFLLVIFTYLGVSYLLPGVHSYA